MIRVIFLAWKGLPVAFEYPDQFSLIFIAYIQECEREIRAGRLPMPEPLVQEAIDRIMQILPQLSGPFVSRLAEKLDEELLRTLLPFRLVPLRLDQILPEPSDRLAAGT